MKNIHYFLPISFIVLLTNFNAFSQYNHLQRLSVNNINTLFNANGDMFHDRTGNNSYYIPEFEFPKDSSTNAIFAGYFWFVAQETPSSTPRVAAQHYFGNDFFAGPISSSFQIYRDPILKLTKQMVYQHYKYYNWPNYTMPYEIANWPGNGSADAGEPLDMAPFIDLNKNGFYDPENGDVPAIMGDEAVFFTFNDSAGIHTNSGGLPLGIEIQAMAFAYHTNDTHDVNNCIFLNFTVINRSNRNYQFFKPILWMDFDLGNAQDDYVGCDSAQHVFYCYNGDENDENNGGAKGYGQYPPAVGVKFYRNNMHSFIYHNNNSAPTGDPRNAQEYFNYANSKWRDGKPIVYGGNGYPSSISTNTKNTRYMYSGNPYTNQGWHEKNAGNSPFDRRGLGSFYPSELQSGERKTYEVVIGVSQKHGNNHLKNLDNLNSVLQNAVNYHLSQQYNTPAIATKPVNVSENQLANNFTIFPNPAGEEAINFKANIPITQLKIFDLTGKEIWLTQVPNLNTLTWQHFPVKQGIYFLEATFLNKTTQIKKLVIQ